VIPARIRSAIEQHLSEDAGRTVRIASVHRVGGGCISSVARIETETGIAYFTKWSEEDAAPGFFGCEAASLAAIANTGAVRVPRVHAHSADWILLEWLEPGEAKAESWQTLGRELAALHRNRANGNGWPADNYIGSLSQANGWMTEWARFWAERRLVPQWRAVVRRGMFDASDGRCFDRLIDRLDDRLAQGDADGASLLHGDLWGGNVHITTGGHIALIDPSCYHGHREVDLAMAELFGGFGPGFLSAYNEAWPIADGYHERRDLYQLYYLLVHVCLFGAGYVEGSRMILRRHGE
jgi:fructosamine-3-kinase